MLKIIKVFFMTLGVVFFFLVCYGVYFFIADPYNLKVLFFQGSDEVLQVGTSTALHGSSTTTVDKNPMLTPTQEEALSAVGIDPAKVPTSVSEEQEACFRDVLGSDRVDQIIGGDSPTPIEAFKSRHCLEAE